MRINIQIEDATPVEAQRVLIGMSFAEDILGKISPAIKIEKAPAKAPDSMDILRTPQPPDIVHVESPVPTSGTGTSPAGATVADPQTKKPGGRKSNKPLAVRANKYGIPPELHRTDKKAYNRLWCRCKNLGIRYEEALKLEKKPGQAKQQEMKKPRATPRRVGRAYLDPENQHPTPAVKKIRDLVVAKNGELKAGMLVRHNGPKASPFFGKEGEILKVADGGQAFVKFGESATWMPAYNVVVIPQAAEVGV